MDFGNQYGFNMDLKINYGLSTGYGIVILNEMDYGLDLD